MTRSPLSFFCLRRITPIFMSSTRPTTLDDLFAEVAAPLGFEVICWEWAGQGKYRVLRLYIDTLVAPLSQGEDSEDSSGSPPGQSSEQASERASASTAKSDGAVASGVSLQDCAKVSRLVGLALDAAEQDSRWAGIAASLKAAYTLEVSSPGIERPLTKLEHFARFVGKKAAVRCEREPIPGQNRKKFSGPILGVTEQGQEPTVRLMDEDLKTEVELPLSYIRKAHLVYEGRI